MDEPSVTRRVIKFATAATIWLIAIGWSSCKNDVIPPDPPKDPRTYTWVCDTIVYPGSSQTWLRAIWGASPTSVYAVGHNASSHAGAMYRFNGQEWATAAFQASGRVTLGDVLGFGPNSIFFVGNLTNYGSDTGFVMEYNGSTWIQHNLPQNRSGYDFSRIVGLSRNDLWVGGGWHPFIFHFDGTTWRRDSLPITERPSPFPDIILRSILVQGPDGVWATVERSESRTGYSTHYLLHRTNGTWSLRDSVRGINGLVHPPWGEAFWRSPSGNVYGVGNGITKLTGDSWAKVVESGIYFRGISGFSDSNVFLLSGFDGGPVAHYNGSTIHVLDGLSLPGVAYADAWTDGTQAFIVGFDAVRSYVWRGK